MNQMCAHDDTSHRISLFSFGRTLVAVLEKNMASCNDKKRVNTDSMKEV